MADPTTTDRWHSGWSRSLYASAVNEHNYGDALACLAEFFDASDARLIRSIREPVKELSKPFSVLEFDRSVRYVALAEALENAGASHGLCALVRQSESGSDVVLVLRQTTPFAEGHRSWLEWLARDIREALDLEDQLTSALPTIASAAQFARLFPTPCVLTDGVGRCLEKSESFDQILGELSGSLRGGRVWFSDPQLQQSWQQTLQHAEAIVATQSFVATGPGGRRWLAHVVPLPSINNHAEKTPQRLMFAQFEKLGAVSTAAQVLRASPPLTKAEKEVLASLLLGHTAKAIARDRGAAFNTVRSQIAAILAKTGHHTQKELIALQHQFMREQGDEEARESAVAKMLRALGNE